MTKAINRITALAATGSITDPVTIKKGEFKLAIIGTWVGTVTVWRKIRRVNDKMANLLVHSGADNAAALTAGLAVGITADECIGMGIYNATDGSFAPLTDNTATVFTGTLAGGTGDDYDVGDECYLCESVKTYTANANEIGTEAEDNADYIGDFTARTSGTARVVISQ